MCPKLLKYWNNIIKTSWYYSSQLLFYSTIFLTSLPTILDSSFRHVSFTDMVFLLEMPRLRGMPISFLLTGVGEESGIQDFDRCYPIVALTLNYCMHCQWLSLTISLAPLVLLSTYFHSLSGSQKFLTAHIANASPIPRKQVIPDGETIDEICLRMVQNSE